MEPHELRTGARNSAMSLLVQGIDQRRNHSLRARAGDCVLNMLFTEYQKSPVAAASATTTLREDEEIADGRSPLRKALAVRRKDCSGSSERTPKPWTLSPTLKWSTYSNQP